MLMSLDLHNRQIKGVGFDVSEDSLAVATVDRGIIKHDIIHRPRTYPYNPATVLTVTAAAGEDNFGDYVCLIPKETFDFNDTPNLLQVLAVYFESFSANDTYTIEFYSSGDEIEYVPLGLVRIKRAAALVKSMPITRPCRDFDGDTEGLYARLKTATGGSSVTISLTVERHLHTLYEVPPSTGVWPTG